MTECINCKNKKKALRCQIIYFESPSNNANWTRSVKRSIYSLGRDKWANFAKKPATSFTSVWATPCSQTWRQPTNKWLCCDDFAALSLQNLASSLKCAMFISFCSAMTITCKPNARNWNNLRRLLTHCHCVIPPISCPSHLINFQHLSIMCQTSSFLKRELGIINFNGFIKMKIRQIYIYIK